MINLSTKFEVFIFTHYDDMKGNRRCQNVVVWGSYGPLKVSENSTIR